MANTALATCRGRGFALVLRGLTAAAIVLFGPSGATGQVRGGPGVETTARPVGAPPNIILIITDDLGYGEVGCYGQKVIRTPTIDALAARGVRFTNAYSGSCVCAPSRGTLLTGLHTGHSAIRDNKELSPEGQQPLPAESVSIAELLKEKGYVTAAIGKWGLGPPGSTGDPAKHGFDLFYGYLCQRHAHNYCPPYLYRNDERVELAGNRATWDTGEVLAGAVYVPDLLRDEAEAFITANRAGPFFLLFATPVPHAALQVPGDSLAEYTDAIPDTPYDGKKGYLKHDHPRAAYAAMVTRMDSDVGRILARVRELGLEGSTLVIFTSDNGPTYNGGTDSEYFKSAGVFRGLKGQLYEGGIHVPLIVSWPGRVREGAVSSAVTGNWDFFTTLASVAGVERGALPAEIDGIDLSPQLFGDGALVPREYLYWEYASGAGWQAVRLGDFKGVRRSAKKAPDGPIELYDLAADPGESVDIADKHPGVVARMREIMAARTPSPIPEWNFAP